MDLHSAKAFGAGEVEADISGIGAKAAAYPIGTAFEYLCPAYIAPSRRLIGIDRNHPRIGHGSFKDRGKSFKTWRYISML